MAQDGLLHNRLCSEVSLRGDGVEKPMMTRVSEAVRRKPSE